MPEFFPFTPGTETSRQAATAIGDASTPLLGRFRAHLPRRARSRPSLLFGGGGGVGGGGGASKCGGPRAAAAAAAAAGEGVRGSVHVGYGYGALLAAGLGDGDDGSESESDYSESDGADDDGCAADGRRRGGYGTLGGDSDRRKGRRSRGSRWWRWRSRRAKWRRLWRKGVLDLWVAPRQTAVMRAVESWWSRWGVLVFLPAGLAVAWCAIPFPQYPLPTSGHDDNSQPAPAPNPGPWADPDADHRVPGHGQARVQVNFWFFLLVYYGFYNLTALIWITKAFNLYSLNWWPSALGFPLTLALVAAASLAVPVPVYLAPAARFLTVHNTAWISWTFVVMAVPVATAFCILMRHERHIGLRNSLSETQRIFTSSWWTGEAAAGESVSARENRRRRGLLGAGAFVDPDTAGLQVADQLLARRRRARAPALMERRRWLPASFVRFVWFCLALLVGLLAYLIGEAYAEIYLRTLPHNNFETIVYVYSWVVTVHLLDMLTAWILGLSEGERVGSYPLSWIFKLYFMLTYQTYVRALYARLRSPSQFIWLQALSSGFAIVLTPLTMTRTYHWLLGLLGLTGQSYGSYQKICARNVFIRSLAENASMLAFLGSVAVLHFGPNKHVYPYFAFDDPDEPYDFRLTSIASATTWACELVAGIVLRALIRWCFGVDVNVEGRLDLAVWPELLPTSVAVMLHVLQNMLFSIVRLQFR
ncbi:hypothetical protein DL763_010393 [Monosporascus cannonballus]|nr:hypothetical protein DL763_010393 [Monosporascus cannonballus]